MPLDGNAKEVGWLSKWGYQVGSLAADAIGRQAIEDAYFAATAEMRAKFADSFINAAKLAADAVEEAKLEAVIFGRLLPVARVDSTNVDYCKVG